MTKPHTVEGTPKDEETVMGDWAWWKAVASAIGGEVTGFTYRREATIVFPDGSKQELRGKTALAIERLASTPPLPSTVDKADVVEAMARALYDCEAERSAHADRIIAAARRKPLGQPSIEPYELCADIFRSDATAALTATEPFIAQVREEERERCAKVAVEYGASFETAENEPLGIGALIRDTANEIAAAIRMSPPVGDDAQEGQGDA